MINKKFAATLICLVTSCSAFCQQHYESNIAIGVKAGATLSKTMFTPKIEQGFTKGFISGVAFKYIEERHFGVIAELNFQQRGWREKFDETNYYFERKLTYIQVPLLAHIYFGSDRFKAFFNAGPEIGFNLGDSSSANFNYNNLDDLPSDLPMSNRNTEQYTMPVKNKIDYGISAGLGAELKLKDRHSVSIEGRAYYGLNSIFSDRKKDVFAGSNGLSFMVTAGYWFRVK
ncbi:MAG: porin family protein [Candidatus Limisoma sp.]|nr:porin family protein [Bacteroidales bacterium]MDD7759242.1 porin family protein [Bacteroidales bacterium]MDY4942973.1 porin family protein [Candidatus Limisoma sp.]MDY6105447.1 porin family protein [Candidatus Limisoma sp.]